MKRKNLNPESDLPTQARIQLSEDSKKTDPRKFRDKLTRADGAVISIPTNATQWNRWNV